MLFTTLLARPRLPGLILAVAMVGESPAFAQVRVATLDELNRQMSPGDLISVVQTTGDLVRGRLQRFGDADLDIQVETERTPGQQRRPLTIKIPLSAIQSFERPRDSPRNGALIGASVGAGIALTQFAWAASVDYNEIEEWGPTYLAIGGIYTGLGALAGWTIDLAHSKPHIRFDAPFTGTMTLQPVPRLSRGPGIALVVSFLPTMGTRTAGN